jgi:hypothetical protein
VGNPKEEKQNPLLLMETDSFLKAMQATCADEEVTKPKDETTKTRRPTDNDDSFLNDLQKRDNDSFLNYLQKSHSSDEVTSPDSVLFDDKMLIKLTQGGDGYKELLEPKESTKSPTHAGTRDVCFCVCGRICLRLTVTDSRIVLTENTTWVVGGVFREQSCNRKPLAATSNMYS